jgi:putative acetyltransferase
MDYFIREIEEKDDLVIESIIRSCLIEYGGNHSGTAWEDENLNKFSKIYGTDTDKYWVLEDENHKVVGGVGIGKITSDICELQKMYLVKEVRGKGVSYKLMDTALTFAKTLYKQCYLETLESMIPAKKFYLRYGFTIIDKPPVSVIHNSCPVKMIKNL